MEAIKKQRKRSTSGYILRMRLSNIVSWWHVTNSTIPSTLSTTGEVFSCIRIRIPFHSNT
jgi:hypothetical protein